MRITVVGEHRLALRPERATLQVEVSFESASKDEPASAATRLIETLTPELEALRDAPSRPVSSFSVGAIATSSWRPWSDDGGVPPLRHAARARVGVTFADVRVLAAFIDRWAAVPGVSLADVAWSLTDERRADAEREVLAAAVARARERAQIIADAAGAGEVRFAEIADPELLGRAEGAGAGVQGDGGGVQLLAVSRKMGDGQGIDLSPDDLEVTARLHVRFDAE